jgi:hypothetical protein
MHKTLQKQYGLMVLPALGLLLTLGPAKSLHLIAPGGFSLPAMLPAALFVVSAITAIAGPLFLRTVFAHSVRSQQTVRTVEFLAFQRRLLWISQITPYLAFVAVFCDFPRFYAAAIVLMGLYALYYYYPSQKRIGFDKKIFRVT